MVFYPNVNMAMNVTSPCVKKPPNNGVDHALLQAVNFRRDIENQTISAVSEEEPQYTVEEAHLFVSHLIQRREAVVLPAFEEGETSNLLQMIVFSSNVKSSSMLHGMLCLLGFRLKKNVAFFVPKWDPLYNKFCGGFCRESTCSHAALLTAFVDCRGYQMVTKTTKTTSRWTFTHSKLSFDDILKSSQYKFIVSNKENNISIFDEFDA